MAEWIPVSPDLDSDGSFAALRRLPNASSLTPVPLDPADDPFGTFYADGTHLDFGVAAQLGLTGIANASTSFKSKTITYDAAMYANSPIQNPPQGGLIFATRWGAGLRTHIYVTDFAAKIDVNLANVAAAASVGLVSASYRVEAFGINDRKVLKAMPPPGRFDEGSYKLILGFVDSVLRQNLIPKEKLVAVPFMIAVDNPAVTFGAPLDRARTALFAMRRIARGVGRADAIGAARTADGIDPIHVETIYTQWARTTAQQPVPSGAMVDRAQAWLDKIKLG